MTNSTSDILDPILRDLEPPSEAWRQRARKRLDTLTKPLGSLGRLEDLAAQIVAIRCDKFADRLKTGVYIFAADHGVTSEGVSAYPREVTRQMVLNYLAEGAAINVLARLHSVALRVVDVGVDAEFRNIAGLLHRKVAKGTRNMLRDAAMIEHELAQALAVGAEMADDAVAAGFNTIAIGEMGIGNTTSASVITCALTGAPPATATGRGTGVDPATHRHKIAVVEAVLNMHFATAAGPIDILRCAGGFEIAAMAGMVLAAARHRLIVVLDGFISTASAALAVTIAPAAQGYLIAAHQSEEPGHKLLLDYLHLDPVLTLNMRLGEGTGAVLAMPILDSAMALYTQMATFASAGVSEASR
jgi:nicotinate-nucleotide--dimethylbenzimidazole phosphoribosyltransferase